MTRAALEAAVKEDDIKTGTLGQLELFDPKLIQLNFDPGVENRIFRIEIFAKVRGGQKDKLGGLPPELAHLTAPNFRE